MNPRPHHRVSHQHHGTLSNQENTGAQLAMARATEVGCGQYPRFYKMHLNGSPPKGINYKQGLIGRHNSHLCNLTRDPSEVTYRYNIGNQSVDVKVDYQTEIIEVDGYEVLKVTISVPEKKFGCQLQRNDLINDDPPKKLGMKTTIQAHLSNRKQLACDDELRREHDKRTIDDNSDKSRPTQATNRVIGWQ